MAGKNSVRIPVALELESDDIVKDYKTTINKISNINDLQSQFKELLKLQKQYIDNAKASTDPMMKALNLQGAKAYSEMLGRIQSQVEKIDKTKMSDFSLPKFQFDDKEIINNVIITSNISDIIIPPKFMHLLISFNKCHCFCVRSAGEHIDRGDFEGLVAFCLEHFQISGEGGAVARNINDSFG